MDTEKFIFLNGELDNQPYSELSQDELNTAQHFVEITRHLQEIHDLFLILNFNIYQLKNNYILMADGNLLHGQQKAESGEDYIAVNAFVTNLIGSGSTLKESLETYINCNSTIDVGTKEKFKNISHKLYDSSFAYRLLIRLRDFSQHGHLSVCQQGNNYYFDLKQIAEKPHFSHNKKLEDEMKRIIEEIMDVYRNVPTLSLTMTIAEYISKLFSLYNKFWKVIENEFRSTCLKFEEVKKAYSENVVSGLFIYDIIDGNAHVVPVEDRPVFMFESFQKEAEQLSQEYYDAYHQLADRTLWIRCINKQFIEIGQGLETL